MPYVQIKLIEGVFSHEQKCHMLSRVTEALVSVGGEKLRPYMVVTLEEVKSGEWTVGGKAIEADDIRTLTRATGTEGMAPRGRFEPKVYESPKE